MREVASAGGHGSAIAGPIGCFDIQEKCLGLKFSLKVQFSVIQGPIGC